MNFARLEIPDVVLIEPDVHRDARGFFFESYHERIFSENGIQVKFVQDNHSRSSQGVVRGLHFQIEPKAQAKLVRVIRGEIFDVALDIRKSSKTFGRFVSSVLSEENARMLYIPAGFAHGFCVLKDGTEFLYKVSEVYSPEHERGILWNDSDLNIPWPKLDAPLILSERDKRHSTWKTYQASLRSSHSRML